VFRENGSNKTGRAEHVPTPLRDTTDRFAAAWRLTRFVPDSSISGRMACRSSLAETTGKSSVSTQASSTAERNRPMAGDPWAGADWIVFFSSHAAGSASASQKRLRSSSIMTTEMESRCCPIHFGGSQAYAWLGYQKSLAAGVARLQEEFPTHNH
jgi:hypothetical protein